MNVNICKQNMTFKNIRVILAGINILLVSLQTEFITM
ncbi:hypothetical protein GGR14_002238 [Butyricimonas faecihominis]|uniref:Uncharacterized protein n=1 Tax=Butyricimonas faecihominis TaxID=1472416 RepID=A0A7W6HY12_9BACT|nr:hypothetical protein [Butyricimonas faecihominis]